MKSGEAWGSFKAAAEWMVAFGENLAFTLIKVWIVSFSFRSSRSTDLSPFLFGPIFTRECKHGNRKSTCFIQKLDDYWTEVVTARLLSAILSAHQDYVRRIAMNLTVLLFFIVGFTLLFLILSFLANRQSYSDFNVHACPTCHRGRHERYVVVYNDRKSSVVGW